jgi:SAM-dependent methyltransferase
MEAAEYENIARVEEEHWYYAGKRQLVREWIERVRAPRPDDRLLDCGAGTGRFAAEMSALCRVQVLDDHEESLRLLREKFQPQQVLRLAGDRVPLADGSLEYVTALDVLEHVASDTAAVREFHRLLQPGGLAVVTVPAGRELWSDWDERLHHFRRYSRRQLIALFPSAQWEIVQVNYTNVAAYPAVWLVRRWRRWFPRAITAGTRAEDRLPPRWLNRVLRASFVGLARCRVPLPFGVSLLLVARRKA